MYHTRRYPRNKRFNFIGAFDRMYADDGPYWQARAEKARDAFNAEPAITDDDWNGFMDQYDQVANGLTWKQIYTVFRVATWTARLGVRDVVGLARETGLIS